MHQTWYALRRASSKNLFFFSYCLFFFFLFSFFSLCFFIPLLSFIGIWFSLIISVAFIVDLVGGLGEDWNSSVELQRSCFLTRDSLDCTIVACYVPRSTGVPLRLNCQFCSLDNRIRGIMSRRTQRGVSAHPICDNISIIYCFPSLWRCCSDSRPSMGIKIRTFSYLVGIPKSILHHNTEFQGPLTGSIGCPSESLSCFCPAFAAYLRWTGREYRGNV